MEPRPKTTREQDQLSELDVTLGGKVCSEQQDLPARLLEIIGRPGATKFALFSVAFAAAIAFAYAIGRQVHEGVASGIAIAFFAWIALVLNRRRR